MSSATRFPSALAISALVHLLLFSSFSVLGIFPNRLTPNKLEITYYRVKSKSAGVKNKVPKEVSPAVSDKVTPGRRIIIPREDKIPERIIAASQAIQKDSFLKSKNFIQKPNLSNSIEFLTKNSIALSPLEIKSGGKLSRDPASIEYGNRSSERIRRYLHKRFSLSNEKGNVYLKFTIGTDGALLGYHIIDEKSNASDCLKQIAIAGLKDAAPFPALPKELNSQATTFSIFIEFINK
jgi:hypothetical protein